MLTTEIALSGALLDRLCQELDIFRGNVYLGSERAVCALLKLGGIDTTTDRTTRALRILTNCELMYRFPVAYKFRGSHAVDRQCRINGWGRMLATTLSDQAWAVSIVERHRLSLEQHLRQNSEAYREHLAECTQARDDGADTAWVRANRFEIPLLT